MHTNVGREAFVYLTHLLRNGVRARQTIFCPLYPNEPDSRMRFASLGRTDHQRFDMIDTLKSLDCLSNNIDSSSLGLTYLWSGLRTIPKYHGITERSTFYKKELGGKDGRSPDICTLAQWHNATFGPEINLDAPFAPGGCFAIGATSARRALSERRSNLESIRTSLGISNAPTVMFMVERSWAELFGIDPSRGRPMVHASGCVRLTNSNYKVLCTSGPLETRDHRSNNYITTNKPRLIDALRSCDLCRPNDRERRASGLVTRCLRQLQKH